MLWNLRHIEDLFSNQDVNLLTGCLLALYSIHLQKCIWKTHTHTFATETELTLTIGLQNKGGLLDAVMLYNVNNEDTCLEVLKTSQLS